MQETKGEKRGGEELNPAAPAPKEPRIERDAGSESKLNIAGETADDQVPTSPASRDRYLFGPNGGTYYYVRRSTLATLDEKINKNEAIPQDIVDDFVCPKELQDDEAMMPVDMRVACDAFKSIPEMVEVLGGKGAGEMILKARARFVSNPDEEADALRPKPITAEKYHDVLDSIENEADVIGVQDDVGYTACEYTACEYTEVAKWVYRL